MNNREKALSLRAAKTLMREMNIDKAMEHAVEIFGARQKQEDPYAMHRAVESLPVAVLLDVLHKKTIGELESRDM